MKKKLDIAIMAALKAGKCVMEVYKNEDFEVDFKGDDSPLTKADLASHKIIMEHLKDTEIPVLSEEGKDLSFDERKNWDKLWIVDPIDGTKEFIKRNGEFTVNIALVIDQKPVLGVIYVPANNTLYYADENGSFKTSAVTPDSSIKMISSKSEKLPIKSDRTVFTVVASKSHLSKETVDYINELEKQHGAVDRISKGSSLKLCMVAEGAADEYPRFAPTMEWDTAAGQAICTFAGKTVFDYKSGQEMIYNRENLLNNWFLVK
ncbi:3'(2'),5'-bisphosphate nucleotidase CysQ [Christiangramia sp. SM2212]|uniref:3'(2'),5'-bisphosphate nucleotidase CysQ n=1 Tax=Christiangramia sediminicola TaxID=3073267 RepID=A0ABU1ELU7_9FLAO|nr:3'(2'),5'-bisphosphate nucleotidase CysQ [Christiangramia sp. SM2212]MDR5589326.1 3'(2'),5'-bisphosphate nucleotidase CysQ [Christiangramia sp. SM2212]